MKIFITGVTGTLGTEVLKQLQPLGHDIYGLTRQESKMKSLEKYCTPILGDIRDSGRMIDATYDMNLVFHFAALKHVDLMEHNYSECLQTNLYGTHNINNAQHINRIRKVVFTSTDKAMNPINTYGLAKALAEKSVLQNSITNVVCRYGNVFGSKGSIFERLPAILKETNTISITHPEMTRFWISLEDAATFVIQSGIHASSSGLKIPKMKAANVLRMLKLFAETRGFKDCEITEIGLRPGEKLHEELTRDLNSWGCKQFTDLELEELFDESRDIRCKWEYGETISSGALPFREKTQLL